MSSKVVPYNYTDAQYNCGWLNHSLWWFDGDRNVLNLVP